MSSIFSISSVTDAGRAAMQEALDHGYTMTFTAMKTGNGIYTAGEDVTGRTALKSLKNTYTIGSIDTDEDGATVSAVFTNYDGIDILVAEDYKINEIGIFCTVNSVEYLYALAAVPNDDGMEMPAYDSEAENLTQFIQEWYIANSNDANITIDPTGAYVAVTDIVDNLTSSSATKPLSAKQGAVLKQMIEEGGSGGHVIVAPNGTEMTQRANLKFTGSNVNVTDDAENDTTVVDLGASTGSITISQSGSVVSNVEVNNATGALALDALFNTNAPTYSIVSSNNTVVTASLNAAKTVLTVTGLKYGDATITISTPATSEYTAASVTLNVKSRVFIPTVGSTYKLGSGAHTGGTADLECVVLDVDGNNAVCITKGVYGAAWPGTDSLDSIRGSYFGDLASAVSGLYLPRAQGGTPGPTTTAPTGVSVYDGSAWVDSQNAYSILFSVCNNRPDVGATYANYVWLGTSVNELQAWAIFTGGYDSNNGKSINEIVAPSFILDLTKVKLHGSLIVSIDAPDMPKIVSWASGTDEEIVAMVQSSDRGELDLTEYWSVGEERIIPLSAMAASGTASNGQAWAVGETHVAQTTLFVLMNKGGKTLSNNKKCQFVVGMKNMLANNGTREGGHMNSTDINTGGWDACARRNWCNGAFYDAIPSSLRPIFKQYKNHTADGQGSTAVDSIDWFALPSEVEILGSVTYANATAEAGNSQFAYYTTAANRIKTQGDSGVANNYFNRSSDSNNATNFGAIATAGNAKSYEATRSSGLSPFGVI